MVLFRAHPTTLPTRKWEGLGGSSVIVDDHGSVPAQYVRQPDPNWKQSKGPFPYVLPDVLTVPPGNYELYFWLSAGTSRPVIGQDELPGWSRRWFPAPWGGASDYERTFILGFCRSAFTVLDELGATVRVDSLRASFESSGQRPECA